MRKTAWLVASGLLTAACAAPFAVADNNHSDSSTRDRLVGVWHIAGQPVNCLTRAPLPVPPIIGIIAFHAGGTSTEAGRPMATQTPAGLGTWHRVGRRQFAATATLLNFDVNGFPAGSRVIRRAITLTADGESFAARTDITVTDASGVPTGFCSEATATRAAD